MLVLEAVDADDVVLQVADLEQGAVEVGDAGEVAHEGLPLAHRPVEDVEKQGVERVVVGDACGGEEAVVGPAAVVGHQLGFEKLEEQDAVDPGEAELEGHGKLPLFCIGPIATQAADLAEALLLAGDLEGVLQEASLVTAAGRKAGDDLFAGLLLRVLGPFFQSDDVQ